MSKDQVQRLEARLGTEKTLVVHRGKNNISITTVAAYMEKKANGERLKPILQAYREGLKAEVAQAA